LYATGLRNPGGDRRNTKREAEKEMCRVSEMFGERVEKNDTERDRREHESEAIDVCSKENKQRAVNDKRSEHDVPGREKMPGRGPRIALIDFPIDQTVEEHRCGSGGDHACQHQQQDPEAGSSIRRHNQRTKSERQRKNRVGKPD